MPGVLSHHCAAMFICCFPHPVPNKSLNLYIPVIRCYVRRPSIPLKLCNRDPGPLEGDHSKIEGILLRWANYWA